MERPGAPRVPCPAQVRFGIYCNLKIYWNLGIKIRFDASLFRVDGGPHGGVENVYVCFSPAKNMR